jgi:predicted kinase
MTATVHIMRGIPGSGKSTKAFWIAEGNQSRVCSADDYFIKDGKYAFVAHEIGKAHQSCLKKFVDLLHLYRSQAIPKIDVVVDNTNLRLWEFDIYVKIAELAGWKVEYHEFVPPRDATLGEYVRECAARNTHGVSANQCLRMASIFEVRHGS